MTNYILFDDNRTDLLPFTFTRPVADIRIGILTIREKWEKFISNKTSSLTEEYLSVKYARILDEDNIFINGSILPDTKIVKQISTLNAGEYLVKANIIIAARLERKFARAFVNSIGNSEKLIQYNEEFIQIRNPWEIFTFNGVALEQDFNLLTAGRKSCAISSTNQIACPEKIFIEEGAKVEFSVLNASAGPIYIDKGAEVMEGSLIRGPFSLGEKAALKMGTKIYGPTTIGPGCKVGGEIQNSVMFANSNKAHDGYFRGNSILGEWCNLGADTNNSNLKNNYSEVKLWNYTREKFIPTGLQFCGLIMGDHSKCGINTMFNTGTVVGVSSNIFGSGYPRNFIPSFSWGGPQGLTVYPLSKAAETAQIVMKRRNLDMSEADQKIFEHIFVTTEKYRRF